MLLSINIINELDGPRKPGPEYTAMPGPGLFDSITVYRGRIEKYSDDLLPYRNIHNGQEIIRFIIGERTPFSHKKRSPIQISREHAEKLK